ncbi:acyltransferase [Bradyrhizobium sp. BRP23]|uniref:acyltransferase family protein n=1 Tax=Bradyrhizobium sp. BRP23 TaxID=2793820 RepID=UPI001CD2E832|nr:acyltransferase [Bradyrhizobium sp. BRP23]MCA1381308.1 acyltransferase [Bradyrhizobium sp. BRP05]MCA1422435.1 acyltransferase [Bradyrhizobium sp. BRP23]
MDKNGGIQAARAIAALSVAYFHSYIALRGFPESAQDPIPFLKEWGFLGVNFFFAISGYVICLIASKPNFDGRSFAIKRLFRLYPMYWAIMAAVACMILLGRYRPESFSHFLYSLTLLPQPSASVYDVSWTLERELVFYTIAAATVPLAGIWGLAVVLAVLAYAGFVLGNPWTFHIVSSTQADFLSGVIVYLISSRLRIGNAVAAALMALGALSLWYTRSHDFVFSVTVCLFLILLGMANLQVQWTKAPLRWLIQLGDSSYSLYLVHLLIFMIVAPVPAKLLLPEWLCEPWRFGSIAVSVALAAWTWRIIEQPMIAVGNRISSTPRRQKPQAAPAE